MEVLESLLKRHMVAPIMLSIRLLGTAGSVMAVTSRSVLVGDHDRDDPLGD
jgi:hypothetical protein